MNLQTTSKILALFLVLCAFGTMAQQRPMPPNPSWDQIAETSIENGKLDLLDQKGRWVRQGSGNPETQDSLTHVLAQLFQEDLAPRDYTRSMELYLINGPLLTQSREAYGLLKDWEENCPDFPEKTWYTYRLYSRLYNTTYKFDLALDVAESALSEARRLGDSVLVGQSYTSLAQIAENSNLKVPALTYFLIGEEIIKRYGTPRMLMKHYEELRDFYVHADEFDEATRIMEVQQELFESSSEFDQLDGEYLAYWSLYIPVSSGAIENFKPLIRDEIQRIQKTPFTYLKNEYLGFYRTTLIQRDDFQGMLELYRDIIPEELEVNRVTVPHRYYRFMAYFSEARGEMDSAAYYWQKASAEMSRQPDLYFKTNFYIRMGEFYERKPDFELATTFFERAIQYANQVQFVPFKLRAVEGLERVSLENGNYELAYDLADERNALEDSVQRINEKEKLALAEVLHDMRLEQSRQAAQLRTELLRSRSFGFGFGLFVFLSGLIFFQFHQTRREKRRSEELLLNILPEDTANELKEHGQTTARKYDHVTILFADFVGFTKLSEKLSPDELVSEIDSYFRAFDDICKNFGLEKIKTIGDAYLAVGGMPTGNTATVNDVVRASLKMQETVAEFNAVRPEASLALRIGLHTGEVVAGVVGTMKFQYDVWGDAVNTAARMEQNSEPGKVNISQSTFEALDDSFKTTHRGQIEAKNKGLLDMYFVESDRQ
ncbi:adenylate/guanylate cyclase domain-containing protein [Cryomorphaceae bacterium]|nr:adenylate/guanylate cyclase domain-containing protein [Cryomorphaceae bacterium]